VRQTIEAAGARLLYLPPYSPDFNPIGREAERRPKAGGQMAFAKLKALLRKAAARSVDELWDTIAETLDAFTPQECEN